MCTRYILGCRQNPTKKYVKKYTADNDLNLRVMVTRYTYGYGWRSGRGPRGGKVKNQFARYTYYEGGVFYSLNRVRSGEDGSYTNLLSPINGIIWDCHELQSMDTGIPVVRMTLRDGRCVSVTMDGEEMAIGPNEWPMLEELLFLDGRRLPSWKEERLYAHA